MKSGTGKSGTDHGFFAGRWLVCQSDNYSDVWGAVLHGLIVHGFEVGRREGERALHGLQGVLQMVQMPRTLLPSIEQALRGQRAHSSTPC